jgi:hypothetical protein
MRTLIATTFLSCLLLAAPSVKAQKPFSYGIKAGVNLSNTSAKDYDMQVGFVGGIVVDYNFNRNVFLRSGLDFSMKGAKYDFYNEVPSPSGNGSTVYQSKNKYRLNYLELPVLIGYRTDIADQTKAYINVGPYFAYGVYGKGKSETDSYPLGGSQVNPMHSDIKYDSFGQIGLKKFDFGISGSIGVEYSKYFINLNYEYGFINAYKGSDYMTDNNIKIPSWHNMSGSATIGYKF